MRKIQNWTDGELSFTQIEPPWWRRILRRPGRLYAKQWRAALAADRTEELVCSECGRDLHGYRGPRCRYCDGTAE